MWAYTRGGFWKSLTYTGGASTIWQEVGTVDLPEVLGQARFQCAVAFRGVCYRLRPPAAAATQASWE
jgi:hypothetical protein